MAASVANSRIPRSRKFELINDRMLQSEELPLADVLDGNPWQKIFEAHEIDFGQDPDAIYTPAITLLPARPPRCPHDARLTRPVKTMPVPFVD